jgi:hypothetical protein
MMDLGMILRGVMDWIGFSKDNDKYRALVNSVMNLLFL